MKNLIIPLLLLLSFLSLLNACGAGKYQALSSDVLLTVAEEFEFDSKEYADLNWVENPASFVDLASEFTQKNNFQEFGRANLRAELPFGMFSFGPEYIHPNYLKRKNYPQNSEWRRFATTSFSGKNYSDRRFKGFTFMGSSQVECLEATANISVLPFTQNIVPGTAAKESNDYYRVDLLPEHESAEPGYYRTNLDNGVDVQLSATERTGIATFTFNNFAQPKLLFQFTQSSTGSDFLARVDGKNSEISGYMTSAGICADGEGQGGSVPYTLYFVAKLDVDVIGSGAWQGNQLLTGAMEVKGPVAMDNKELLSVGVDSGIWADVIPDSGQTVTMRVGISYVSEKNARENLATEQNFNSDINGVRAKAFQAWNKQLHKVKLASQDIDKLSPFYTALYHAQLQPRIFSDVNGEFPDADHRIQNVAAEQQAQYVNFNRNGLHHLQQKLIKLVDVERADDIALSVFRLSSQSGGHDDEATFKSDPSDRLLSAFPGMVATTHHEVEFVQDLILNPWMHLFTGQAYKTQEQVREVLTQLRSNKELWEREKYVGLLSSAYVFSALGVYPIYPDKADMLLSSPLFSRAKIGNLTINALGTSEQNRYIQGVLVDGRESLNSWFSADYIAQPVVLDIALTSKVNSEFGGPPEHRPSPVTME